MLQLSTYSEALERQRRRAGAGRRDWLLFTPPPTYTITRRVTPEEFLVAPDVLEAQGACVLRVDRGGRATYHGPGQIVGFPVGSLEDFTGDSRGVRVFVTHLVEGLRVFVAQELRAAGDGRRVDASKARECAGVWVNEPMPKEPMPKELTLRGDASCKIAAVGLAFHRGRMAHGFSLNVTNAVQKQYSQIHACGDPSTQTTWLCRAGECSLDALAGRLDLFLKNWFDNSLRKTDTFHHQI